jgi:hypothetical protein
VPFRLCRRADWQAHRKHRAFARAARHGHVAAHHAGELARDGKPEAGAAKALRGRSIDMTADQQAKLFEEFTAAVSYRELDPVAPVDYPPRPQLDFALLVNLQALLNRLSRICRSRMGSTVSGPRSAGASTASRFLFCSASCRALLSDTAMLSLAAPLFTSFWLAAGLKAALDLMAPHLIMTASSCRHSRFRTLVAYEPRNAQSSSSNN